MKETLTPNVSESNDTQGNLQSSSQSSVATSSTPSSLLSSTASSAVETSSPSSSSSFTTVTSKITPSTSTPRPKVATSSPPVKLTTVRSATSRQPVVLIVAGTNKRVSTTTISVNESASQSTTVTPLGSNDPVTTGKPVITNSTIVPAVTSSPVKPEVNPINTKISLYTRKNALVGHPLLLGDLGNSVASSPFDSDLITRVIIHGSFDGVDYGHWMRDMKTRLLEVEDANVIIVDWSATANLALTSTRVSNARMIGHQVARILEDFHVS